MRKFLLLSVLLGIMGCYASPKPFPTSDGVFDVPFTTTSGFTAISSGEGSNLNLPVGLTQMPTEDEKVSLFPSNGKIIPVIFEITVPPSDKSTRIRVSKAQLSAYQTALTNESPFEIQTNNPNITVAKPEKALLGRWVLAVLAVVAVLLVAVAKVTRFSFLDWIAGLWKAFRK